MGEALFRVLEKKHELTLLQLPHKQLQRSLSFLYHESSISKTLTSTILCFSSSRQRQCLAFLKKQEFLGDEQLGPLPIVLMYFKFKIIPVSMLSLCAMAAVSMTQHHQQHLHYLRPVDSRKRIKLQYLSIIQCCCLGELLHQPYWECDTF